MRNAQRSRWNTSVHSSPFPAASTVTQFAFVFAHVFVLTFSPLCFSLNRVFCSFFSSNFSLCPDTESFISTCQFSTQLTASSSPFSSFPCPNFHCSRTVERDLSLGMSSPNRFELGRCYAGSYTLHPMEDDGHIVRALKSNPK